MFAPFTRLLSRQSPTSWDPSTTIPPGVQQVEKRLITRVSPSLRLTYEHSLGADKDREVVCGTVLFRVGVPPGDSAPSLGQPIKKDRAVAVSRTTEEHGDKSGYSEMSEVAPPPYDDALASSSSVSASTSTSTDAANLIIIVTARFNDDTLWQKTKIALEENADARNLIITTPINGLARMTSQISFHVTIWIPPSMSSMEGLRWTGGHWRILGDTSLASLHVAKCALHTDSTPIHFATLSVGLGDLRTDSGTLDGKYVFARSNTSGLDPVDVQTKSGQIRGEYTFLESGTVATGSGNVHAQCSAAMKLHVKSGSGPLNGVFEGIEELKVETRSGTVIAVCLSSCSIGVSSGSGRIDATVYFEEREPEDLQDGDRRRCKVVARTESGAMKLKVRPFEASLDVDIVVESRSGQALCVLPNTFDGHFKLGRWPKEVPHTQVDSLPPPSFTFSPEGASSCRLVSIRTAGMACEGIIEARRDSSRGCTFEGQSTHGKVELSVV